ncbi:MAG: stalk domain-containing protein [Bacillota bacterium]
MKYKTMALLIYCLAISLIFTGGRPASAYTSEKVLSVPTVNADSTTSLGTLLLKEEYARSIKNGDCLSISLPSYVELQNISVYFLNSSSYVPYLKNSTVTDATYKVNYSNYYNSPGTVIDLAPGTRLLVEDKNRFSLQITEDLGDIYTKYGASSTATFRCYVYFDSVKIKASAPEGGEVKATLDGTGGFSSSVQTVAKIASSSGGTTAAADEPQDITDRGGRIATITISENVAGALKKNDTDCKNKNTVKLVLPAGFSWGTVTLLPGWGFTAGDVDYTVGVDTSGYSVLYLKVNTETTRQGRLTILGNVTVDESIARAGKVEVSYEGTNPGVSPAVLTVANYSVPGCSLKEKTTTEVIAGHVNQPLGEFTIAEGMAGDLAEGRTITLTLPDGVKWHTYPTARRESGDCVLGAAAPVGDDGRVIRYAVTGAGSDKSVFCFKYATVDLAVCAPEQVEIAVGGSAGAKGKVAVGYVIAPVKLSAGKTTVSAGVQSQPGGEVTISEEMPGALRAKDAAGAGALLKLTLPAGATFDRIPQVEVSEGDLILDKTDLRLEQEDRALVIPVEKSSSVPSTIRVSGVSLNLNRMVPEGDIKLDVGGTALSETIALFSDDLNKLEVTLASCITPAPGEKKTGAVFTIGSTSYEIGGKKQEMDVAPYIKENRTYGPVRYIANALGLRDQDIFWEETTQTVTLMRGKRVAQLKVGRASILIQGVEMPIDVAPELVDPGRVMLPYRWVAFALGASVSWNEEKQQVTIHTI